MKQRKVQVTVYLTPEQVVALKSLSTRTEVPQSVYIRQGIESILAAKGMRKRAATVGGR